MFPLVVDNAISRRRGEVLVGPISLALNGVGTTAILGPNGSGKTTLLRLLHGIARLNAGSIRWTCPTDMAQKAQAFVFQRPVMLRRSVRDNLAYPLTLRGTGRAEIAHSVADWADRVGLADKMNQPAPLLSGGEQQKLALARALITDPQVLFLDEPCAALDGRSTRAIEQILMDAKARGTRLIMSTHDLGQARRMADSVVFLLSGQLHEQASADAFFARPQTPAAQAFLNGDIVE